MFDPLLMRELLGQYPMLNRMWLLGLESCGVERVITLWGTAFL